MAKRTTKKKTTKKTTRKRVVEDSGPAIRLYDEPIGMGKVLGQHRAMEILGQSMQSQRVHHAWIFHGPKGVGKFTAAVAWAATILDPSSAPNLNGDIEPDPESQVQGLLRAGTHPDLHVIKKELAKYHEEKKVRDAKLQTIPKAVVEEHLIVPATLAPTIKSDSIAGKVFIIDEAELLDRSPNKAPVQNAILKTLEEPAPGTVIILVTSSEDRLLPTIRSRCQRVSFTPLDDDAMREWMRTQSLDLPPEEHHWLMQYASGSPGRLLAAIEAGLYQWHIRIEPMCRDADRGVHPISLGSTMGELVDEWAGKWVKIGDKLGENRSKEAANRMSAEQMFALIAQRARKGLHDPSTAHRSLHTIDCVTRAKTELDTNVQVKFVMEHLAAGLSEKLN
ncbi:MAG: AAA family ATPase [Phycisphaerales bacterium]|nr:AAA family ATPase [Phycisphaerales bacterium]